MTKTAQIGPIAEDHRGRALANLTLAMVGGILIVNSILAEWLIYPNRPYLSTISAVVGSLILLTPILMESVRDIRAGKFFMNELVALAVLAAFVMGKYQEAGVIAFFVLIAISIEERTAVGARLSIEGLIKLTPNTCRRIDPSTQTAEEIAVDKLAVDDVIRIRPGENFPADGIIIQGAGTVNQASITGESFPEDKTEGGEVYAGTENLTARLDIRVTRIGPETMLGKVQNLIEAAQRSKHPLLRLTDQYAVYYTPTILMICALVWFFTQDSMRVIFILVIACPCALIVATPSAVLAAVAAASRLGLYIKNVADIETAANIDAVVFDKTGTITEGKLEVARLQPVDGTELKDLVHVAVSAEAESNHPVADAIRRLAAETKIVPRDSAAVTEIAGIGVIAEFDDGATYRVGRENWLRDYGVSFDALHDRKAVEQMQTSLSLIYVAEGENLLGWIGLRDAIRPSAGPCVAALRDLGIRYCGLVSGDNDSVTQAVADQIGIDNHASDCLPEQKVNYIKKLESEGYSVLVVGDGVNDAPALATGNLGLAMGAIGSDIAVNSASIALMNNDLTKIPFLIRLSRKARQIINLNLLLGIGLIVGGIMLFIFGNDMLNRVARYAGVDSSMMKALLAAILQVGGTLAVFFNSARLVRFGEELSAQ